MKYSVIIPTYNHCDKFLKPCIEAILKYSHIKDIELIISANGCTDNTFEYLGNLNFHNAYPGGYIDHIFNVCKNALAVKNLFTSQGGEPDFTDEELIFVALHHDLGKLGTKEELHYHPNESDWHVKNKGEVYTRNSKNSYMAITDRTFFLLNRYGIQYNENEYFGIKLTDGMYDEDNVKYYKVFDVSKYLKSNIQYIMHWADHMSTVIERQNYNKSK